MECSITIQPAATRVRHMYIGFSNRIWKISILGSSKMSTYPRLRGELLLSKSGVVLKGQLPSTSWEVISSEVGGNQSPFSFSTTFLMMLRAISQHTNNCSKHQEFFFISVLLITSLVSFCVLRSISVFVLDCQGVHSE